MRHETLLNALGGLPDRLMNIGFLAERKHRNVSELEYGAELTFYDSPDFREGKRFLTLPDSAPPLTLLSQRAYGENGGEHLYSYPSRYEPRNPAVRDRFAAYTENRTGYLWLWRHHRPEGAPPPPLVLCVHGFRMGHPARAKAMFRVRKLFAKGLDVALFIQPHHWRRAAPTLQQHFFMAEDLPLTLENVGQQVHDLHACYLALMAQGYDRIGLIGGSLGGMAVALYASQVTAPAFIFAVVPAIRVDTHLDPVRSNLPFPVEESLRQASFRALDLIDPSFYPPRMDAARIGVVYHKGDRINAASATRRWVQRWNLQEVTALAGGHWVVFDRKARAAAWYGWLTQQGFI